jgi:tyrosinase
MLSKWLFTTAIAVFSLAGSSIAAPGPQNEDVVSTPATINLLTDELPPYDKTKDTDGLLKATYDAIEKLVKDEQNANKVRRSGGGCDLTKVKVRREWWVHPSMFFLSILKLTRH